MSNQGSQLARRVADNAPSRQGDAETQVREAIKARLPTIKALLPDVLDERKLAALVLTEVHKTPALASCDEASLIGCVLRAAALGLQFGGDLGQAYLIPRRNQGQMECTLQLGYRGVVALARRSGEIESITTRSVYAGDEFDYEYGLNERLVHRPTRVAERTDADLTHAYCVVKFRGGGADFEVLDRQQIEARRKRGKGAQPAWQTDYAKMAEKSAILAMKGRLPLASEVVRALGDDGAAISVTTRGGGALEARHDVAALEPPRQVDPGTGEVTASAAGGTSPPPAGRGQLRDAPAAAPGGDNSPGAGKTPDDSKPQTGVDVAGVLSEAGVEPPLHLAVVTKASAGRTTDMGALTEREAHLVQGLAETCARGPEGFVRAALLKLKAGTEEAVALASWLAEQAAAEPDA